MDPATAACARSERLMQNALHAGAKIAKAALKGLRFAETGDQEPRTRPLKEQSNGRFISVFTITQAESAGRIGVDQGTLARWERGGARTGRRVRDAGGTLCDGCPVGVHATDGVTRRSQLSRKCKGGPPWKILIGLTSKFYEG